MRLSYLNICIAAAEFGISVLELIRSRKSFWKDLGGLWYVRGAYLPDSFGVTIFDLQFSSLDDFELAFDFGPFTFALGRDFSSAVAA